VRLRAGKSLTRRPLEHADAEGNANRHEPDDADGPACLDVVPSRDTVA
jgi:hypothetical protein